MGHVVTRQSKGDRTNGDAQRARAFRYAGIGLELAGSIIGLTLAGYWIDLKFDTQPTGLTVGASLGIIGGMYNFIRQAVQMSGEQPSRHSRDETDQDHDRPSSE